MVYLMPDNTTEEPRPDVSDLTPRQIVAELDRYIIGQDKAKRAVAIALRNRMRRQKLPKEIAEEIIPKNILMIGTTGVGKTEIARRLARLAGSPFIKVEASKFTEVGYVGRDVESIIRDLVEIAVEMTRLEKRRQVRGRAEAAAEGRLLNLLVPPAPRGFTPVGAPAHAGGAEGRHETVAAGDVEAGGAGGSGEPQARLRERMREQLIAGKLEDREVEIDLPPADSVSAFQIFGAGGMEELGVRLKDAMPGIFGGRPRRRKMPVREAREHLIHQEEDRLLDQEAISADALRLVQESGIVFIDEMDKVAGRERTAGPDVSREGVQRDLLPIVEGTIVNTKYGMVRTDHILFIAAGAFHVSKPSDLIPEMQGRFPIRVELESLGREEFVRILREPRSSLVRQYQALVSTEGVTLDFTDDAIEQIAGFAVVVNETTENIGARRLHTVMERLLEQISFEASERSGERVLVDSAMVRETLSELVKDQDLSRYVL